MRAEADRYRKDLVQPGDPGFKTLYRKEHDKLEKESEQRELTRIKNTQGRDKFYKDNNYNIHKKELAKIAIEVTEKDFWDED